MTAAMGVHPSLTTGYTHQQVEIIDLKVARVFVMTRLSNLAAS
jgi:hypothetical protein